MKQSFYSARFEVASRKLVRQRVLDCHSEPSGAAGEGDRGICSSSSDLIEHGEPVLSGQGFSGAADQNQPSRLQALRGHRLNPQTALRNSYPNDGL